MKGTFWDLFNGNEVREFGRATSTLFVSIFVMNFLTITKNLLTLNPLCTHKRRRTSSLSAKYKKSITSYWYVTLSSCHSNMCNATHPTHTLLYKVSSKWIIFVFIYLQRKGESQIGLHRPTGGQHDLMGPQDPFGALWNEWLAFNSAGALLPRDVQYISTAVFHSAVTVKKLNRNHAY